MTSSECVVLLLVVFWSDQLHDHVVNATLLLPSPP